MGLYVSVCVCNAASEPGGNGKQKLALWQVFMFQTFLCVPTSTASVLLADPALLIKAQNSPTLSHSYL